MSEIDDALDDTPTPARKRKTKVNAATKPSKAVSLTPKPGPTPKGAKTNGKTAPVAAKGKTAPVAAKGKTAPVAAKAAVGRPKSIPSDLDMTQPDDSVVLKAVRKLKVAEMASKFSAGLGVHRRVIRAQLQRLSKDKANGVGMKKEGPNWFVSNTQK